MVVTSVISCGLCLHIDGLRDLKQKLLLRFLEVTLPRGISGLGVFARLEIRSRSAGWKLGFVLVQFW